MFPTKPVDRNDPNYQALNDPSVGNTPSQTDRLMRPDAYVSEGLKTSSAALAAKGTELAAQQLVAAGVAKAAGVAIDAAEVGAARVVSKPINLPAWKKISVDMAHILPRHMEGGAFSEGKSVFAGMSEAGIRGAIREAYESSAKVAVQGDRIKLSGKGGGFRIEMWFNRGTNVIETAYAVGR